MWLLPVFWAFSLYGMLAAPSLPFLLAAFATTYLYIEAYGAVLHVVLDNPNFLHLPSESFFHLHFFSKLCALPLARTYSD